MKTKKGKLCTPSKMPFTVNILKRINHRNRKIKANWKSGACTMTSTKIEKNMMKLSIDVKILREELEIFPIMSVCHVTAIENEKPVNATNQIREWLSHDR